MQPLRLLAIAGLVIALFTAGWLNAPGARSSLRELRATGATWVELAVTASTPSVRSTVIDRLGHSTPTDASLRTAIAYAHSLGLKVLLKPHIDPFRSQWRGEIGESFTEPQWATWFANYRAFIVHYAFGGV